MPVVYYRGKRLYFRPLELSDEPLLRRWINDPDVWRTLDRCWPTNERLEREFIERLYASSDEIGVGIALSDGNRLIGAAGLRGLASPNRCANFGLFIGDAEHRGRGYGSEATALMLKLGFEEFNLHRIELSVFATNETAIRSYERCGFVREGCQREAYYRGGRYIDVLRFGLLKSEWFARPREDGGA